MQHNLKKSRYKICFQTRSKVWIYKDSRLRNFYRFRSKIILKKGFIAKLFLITKNMKWTVARRQMVPYIRKQKRFKYFYKNIFFTKQKLKNFYGGLKEFQIRNIFKKNWNFKQNFRTNIFISAFEQRLATILFRMRLIPTIFICNQIVKHQGVFVNLNKITSLHFCIKIGDIITLSKTMWNIFYLYIFERLFYRYWGNGVAQWRRRFFYKKLHFHFYRKKGYILTNFKLKNKVLQFKNYFLDLEETFNESYCAFKVFLDKNSLKIFRFFFKYIKIFLQVKFKKNLKKMLKICTLLKKWARPDYKFLLFLLNFKIKHCFQILNYFEIFIHNFMIEIFLTFFTKNASNIFLNDNINMDFFSLNNMLNIFLEKSEKNFWIENFLLSKIFYKRLKKKLYLKPKNVLIKRKFKLKLKNWRYKRLKKKKFKHWCRDVQFYTPNYLMVDFLTLQAIFIYNPEPFEIIFNFSNSYKQIISFYKQRAL